MKLTPFVCHHACTLAVRVSLKGGILEDGQQPLCVDGRCIVNTDGQDLKTLATHLTLHACRDSCYILCFVFLFLLLGEF